MRSSNFLYLAAHAPLELEREREREFQGLAVTSTDFESNFGAEFVNN